MNYTIEKINQKTDQAKIESLFDDAFHNNHYMQKKLKCLFKGGFDSFDKYSIKACLGEEIIAVLIGNSCDIFLELEDVYEQNVKGFEDLRNKPAFKSHILIVKEVFRNLGVATELISFLKNENTELHYMWGIQREDISKMDFFLKRREVVLTNEDIDGIYTVQRFKKDSPPH